MSLGLGIDAGGTYTKLLLAGVDGRVRRRARMRTHPEKGGADYVKRLAAAVRKLERGAAPSIAVCLACAGDVDPVKGILRRSPNLSALERFPLRDRLSRALDRPVIMHNDANMAAWGVYVLELKRKLPNVIVLTLGTGVGGGAVVGGRLLTGATGSAGEFGHMRVADGGALCGCGARGCLEAYAGTRGILRTAAVARRQIAGARYSLAGLTPQKLARAAARRDPGAREAWRRVGGALGVGVVSLIYAFNPDAVVLTGGVAKAGPLLLGPIRRRMRAESFRAPFAHAALRAAAIPDLGARGAALYALDRD